MSATKKGWMFKHEIARSGALFGRAHGVSVVFEGDRAHTDGKVITIPSIADSADLTQEQMMIIRGYIDHEAGHLRHSDMPLIMEKYNKYWGPNGKEGLIHLHNSFEDMWLEPRVIRDYVGSRKNFKALSNVVNKKEVESIRKESYDISQTNADSVGLGVRIAGRRSYGCGNEHAEDMFNSLNKNVQEWSEKINEEVQKCTSTTDVIRVAKAVYKLLEDDPNLEQSPEDFTEDKQQELADQVEDGEPNGGDGETSAQQAPYGKLHPSKAGGLGDDYAKVEDGFNDYDTDGPDGNDGMNEILHDAVPAIGRPTGDLVGAYRVYSTRGDRVVSMKSPRNDKRRFREFDGSTTDRFGSYEDQKAKISTHTSVVKTKLRRGILAQQRRDWEYGRETGTLNTRRLTAAALGSTAVYKKRTDREDFDTAITVLVDQSGSMSGSKIEVARQCAIALGEALEGTSISYSIVGFTAAGWPDSDAKHSKTKYHRYENNYMLQYKDFDQPLRTAKDSIAKMSAHSNNADYDAIVWAVAELKARPEARKILVVLSDGEPACHSDAGQSELIRHCKLAVKDAEKMGVEVVGMGILSSAVERIYDDHIVVESLKDFAETYLNKFVKILIKKGKRHTR